MRGARAAGQPASSERRRNFSSRRSSGEQTADVGVTRPGRPAMPGEAVAGVGAVRLAVKPAFCMARRQRLGKARRDAGWPGGCKRTASDKQASEAAAGTRAPEAAAEAAA
jgi:hypothetical protein